MTTKISNASAIVACDAITTNMGASPLLRIYSGAVPADADASLGSAVLLAELDMDATPFAGSTDANPGAIAVANAITDDSSADASGTASFFRIYDSTGATSLAQGSVGTAGADLNLSSTAIVVTAPVSITDLSLTVPE